MAPNFIDERINQSIFEDALVEALTTATSFTRFPLSKSSTIHFRSPMTRAVPLKKN